MFDTVASDLSKTPTRVQKELRRIWEASGVFPPPGLRTWDGKKITVYDPAAVEKLQASLMPGKERPSYR